MGKFVDMHVHTCYSDGTYTPEEAVAKAIENNVAILAVADHNVLEGSKRTKELCSKAGIKHIPAVEIDTFDLGRNFHILAYGVDMENSEFINFVKATRFMLDESSYRLIEAMEKENAAVSLDSYFAYDYDKSLGGWKALHYLLERKVTGSLKEGMLYYGKYGINHSLNGYATIKTTCMRIQRAGGYAVLAHPGETINMADMADFKKELAQIIELGVHGIECYYPLHTPEMTEICLALCKEHDLLITAGSDCHGSFLKRIMGEGNVTKDMLSLKDLLDR